MLGFSTSRHPVFVLLLGLATGFIPSLHAAPLPGPDQPGLRAETPGLPPSAPLQRTEVKPVVSNRPIDVLDREARLSRGLIKLLMARHLRQRTLDDTTSKLAFDIFITSLDPRKLYFTETDIDRLRAYDLRMDDQIRAGRLDLAYEAGALWRQRTALVAGWIIDMLSKPFDFTRDELHETDGSKRSFAKDDDKLRERWRGVLKYDVLRQMADARQAAENKREAAAGEAKTLPSTTDDMFEAEARDRLSKRYEARFKRMRQDDPNRDVDRFINAFLRVYDPHTAYLSPFRKQQSDIRIRGSFEGIGASLRLEDGLIKVQEIMPGSASWRQGQLKPQDVIVGVAQEGEEPVDVMEMNLREVVQLIRGTKGTVVRLSVRKPDGELVTIPITRDVVQLEATYARAAVLKHDSLARRFAYINLPRFYGSIGRHNRATRPRQTATDLHLALEALKLADVHGLILDLRGNSGGLLTEALRATGLFIKEGPVLQMRNGHDKQWTKWDKDAGIAFTGPMVIMVDQFSASASEIVASALQDYGRAVVVGSVTRGKGTVQNFYSLDKVSRAQQARPPTDPPLGTLKLTILQYYRIKGGSIQLDGVVPDVTLPDPAAHLASYERTQTHAIPRHTIAPLRYSAWAHSWDIAHLRAESLLRQARNTAFDKLKARTAFLHQQRNNTQIPLHKATWHQWRQEVKEKLLSLELDDTTRFHVRPVEYVKRSTIPDKIRHEKAATWAEKVGGDVWIEEALRILDDMAP